MAKKKRGAESKKGKISGSKGATGEISLVTVSCANCDKCVCKNWNSEITPQFVRLFELHLESLKKFLTRNHPQSTDMSDAVELHPKTGIFIERDKLDELLLKSNNKKRAMVRNFLIETVDEDYLISSGTAMQLHEKHPNIRTAILGYLKHNFDMTLTIPEYNNIVNHKIQHLRENVTLSPEEKERKKAESRARAKRSRENKKLRDPSNELSASKRIKISSPSSTAVTEEVDADSPKYCPFYSTF